MKLYKKYEDTFEFIKAYLGIGAMTIWGIMGINKMGVPFT